MFFFFNDTATTEIYTLSLHDALPISITRHAERPNDADRRREVPDDGHAVAAMPCGRTDGRHVRGRQGRVRSEEHTSELQSRLHLVCRLLLEKKKICYSSRVPSTSLCT